MFGIFKKKEQTSTKPDILVFLNKQSDLLINAIETKSVDRLYQTFTSETREYIKMQFHRDDLCFGLERYRKRSWQLLEENNGVMTWNMFITHNNIHVTGKVYVPLGDEITQTWKVKETTKGYVVMDICQA